ncbi:MAG: ECF transporter S component [Patescibacteria group bacterium]|nr:ECF transporter S component [Patescibacteria group bacterium]
MKENILEKPIIKISALKQALVIIIFISLTIAMPMIAHQYQLAGNIFLPMHFFVLAGGLIFGKKTGFIVGGLSPVIVFALSGRPSLALIPVMTLELAAYGFWAGYFREKELNSFTSIVLAMILGRVVLFLTAWVFLSGNPFIFLFSALNLGMVGIFLQLALIPFLIGLISNFRQN